MERLCPADLLGEEWAKRIRAITRKLAYGALLRVLEKMQSHEIIPLDPDEFSAAHEYALMVSENEFIEEIPALKRKLLRENRVLQPTNVLENRFSFAVMRFFHDRKHDKGWSFMVRFYAMMNLVRRMRNDERLQPFLREIPGGLGFHKAMFEVAATQKLSPEFEFRPASFLQSVEQAADRMDAEESAKTLPQASEP